MDRIQGVEHAAEEAVELMEKGEVESKKSENQLDRQQSQSRPESPNTRKINIEEIEEVFKKRNFRRGFSMFDENKDGQIDIRELKRMISHMGNSIPYDVTQKILSMSDTNNDGYLDYQEFVKMVNNPQLSVLFGKYINTYVNALVPKRKQHAARDDTLDTIYADTQDKSFEEQYSCWPPPIAMTLISVIEIIFFTIDEVKFNAVSGTGPMATALMYDPHRRYEAWRFLTYMFVHIGYMHLCVNLIVQIVLGIPLEMVHRGWRVVIIYLSGVIAGSLATSITDPTVYLAGASGGVYALITAHIASVIMNWKEMTLPFLQIIIFILVTVIDFGTAIYNRYYLKVKDQIGYEAHFAGAVAGLLVGIFVLRNIEKNSCEKKLWWVALVTFCCLILAGIVFNIAYPSHFPVQY